MLLRALWKVNFASETFETSLAPVFIGLETTSQPAK